MSELLRKCRIEEVFDAGFIELIRLVPVNPFVRALVLKFTGTMPGTECATFEQVKDWVEINYARPVRKQPADDAIGIDINVDFSEREYGRADYSVPRSGTESFRVSADDLLEIVQKAVDEGDGMDAIVEVIAEKIDADAWEQCEPAMDDYGNYDYSDHESSDSGDGNVDYSKPEIREAVLTFIHAHHPELANEL